MPPAPEEEDHSRDGVTARVVGDAGSVLTQREGASRQETDPGDEEQCRSDPPAPRWTHPSMQSDGMRHGQQSEH